jgi:hypothetical protein
LTLTELRIDLVILTCAVSAGIHGALVQDHFGEGTGAGVGFVVATVLLAVLALALTRSPSRFALVATAAVFAGLITSYALVITTGVPVVHPDVEAVDGLALFTKGVELVGLVLAASLAGGRSSRPLLRPQAALAIPIALGVLVATFSALAALAVSGGMHMTQTHTHQPPMTISVSG